MSDWTLEGEIVECFGGDVPTALRAWGLIGDGDAVRFEVVRDWYRSGSESYSYVFSVVRGSERTTLRCKACVALGLGSVVEVFSEWMRRRELMSASGVLTPRVYCARSASLIEEEIAFDLRSVIQKASAPKRYLVLGRLGFTVGTLARLGFSVLSLHDLRSRGEDVVWIDFGEDLGPPGMVAPGNSSALEMLVDYVEVIAGAGPKHLEAVRRGYELAIAKD